MIHPDLIIGARLGVEKRAASLGDLVARGGGAVGKGIGTVLGGQTQNVLRYAPTVAGATIGAAVGSRRPDLVEGEAPTRGQRIRGALAGAVAGGALGHMSGVGQSASKAFAEKAAPLMQQQGQLPFGGARSFLDPRQAAQQVLSEAGQSLGRDIAAVPGRVKDQVVGGARLVGHTVTHPVESAKNIAQAAVDPLRTAVKDPRSVFEYAKQQASHPLGAFSLAQSGYEAAQNLEATEDPNTGRQRGLGERVLGSAGQLGGTLAYGAYRGPASQNNPLTSMIGSTIGGNIAASGGSAVGRKLDTIASRLRAQDKPQEGTTT